MKKFIATISILTVLASLTVVPVMAHDKGKEDKGGHDNNITLNLTDISGHWAEKYIKDLVKKGVISGDDHHRFSPEGSVSRAQFAVMVTKYFNLDTTATKQDFADVKTDNWAYKYVEASKDYFDAFRDLNGGINFHPSDAAKRQDVTYTLVKILVKLDPNIKLMDATAADALLHEKFSDADLITPALRPYVATAVQNNLIHGDGKGHFAPQNTLSRAQAATMLDILADAGIVVDGSTTTNGGTTDNGGTTNGGTTTNGGSTTTTTTTDTGTTSK